MSTNQEDRCIFCRIIRGELVADIVYKDDIATAFWDASPKAPVHILIVPNQHIQSVNEISQVDEAVFGHLFSVARHIAQMQNIHQSGYRLVTNVGVDGGQSIFHLHLHLLGGRRLGHFSNW